jgi:hypothetical protein
MGDNSYHIKRYSQKRILELDVNAMRIDLC